MEYCRRVLSLSTSLEKRERINYVIFVLNLHEMYSASVVSAFLYVLLNMVDDLALYLSLFL